jgi:ribosomal-protein-alanine N-acetyltransferase
MMRNPFADARIDTARLLLRPFTMADLHVFQEIARQEEVLEFLPESDRMTGDQLEGVLEWLIRCYHTNTRERIEKFTLAAVLKRTGEIVGWCGLGPLEFDENETEIYVIFSRTHWGLGLATEAASALLRYALSQLGLRRVVAVVHPANRASVRVTEKLGMKPEGTIVGLCAAHRDYEGHVLYSLGSNGLAGMAKAAK